MLNWFFKKRVESTFAKYKRKRAFIPFKDIKNILILFDYRDLEQVREIAEDLREVEDKKVTLWTYDPELGKNQQAPWIKNGRVLGVSDLSFWGDLNPRTKRDFEDLPYDTLFSFIKYDVQTPNILTYLLGLNKAKFCVGIQQLEKPKIYDFVIIKGEENTLLDTYSQIKYYGEKLNLTE